MGESLEGISMAPSRLLEIPVSIAPTDAIRALRLIGESRGWSMHRIEESRMVHRWAIVVPLSRQARVLGLVVDDGEAVGLSIRSWSYIPGSAGRLSTVSFEVPRQLEGESWTSLLREWSDSLPRCPWKWSFGERSMIGYFLPEFRRSRVLFRGERIDIDNWQGGGSRA
ncbi:MAG: hypothetical protein CXX69_00605 [Candidatus Thalassarchaeum betae]|uniref:Uncharacterized protein n=1 Tax=Candidatus Thalassarchaeum betae TaxID=2599289 RepID=A0A2V3HUG9_9ARCH|nr:MAG: hypothetical protein CXX69_00605 [Candidatus Thalassoarchaea betae]PXF27227.1 MAG: hypothetical protein CXX70_00435 [Euryarchaeota archaeon]HIM13105.1 hypothetical protein [Candidatus Poseidoniales archaeon]HIM92832.1 hypothetical protein [Candidatus Poseidoniales archaeon]